MPQPPNPPPHGKIRLPRAVAAPGHDVLTDMFTQATDNKPREIELVWADATIGKTYSIGVKYEPEALQPTWTLWEDNGQESAMLWRFESTDFQLLTDMLSMLQPAKPAPAAVQAAPQQISFGQQAGQPQQQQQPGFSGAQPAAGQSQWARPDSGGAPQSGGYAAPPQQGGYSAAPQQGGYAAPQQQGGYAGAPSPSGYSAPHQQPAGYGAAAHGFASAPTQPAAPAGQAPAHPQNPATSEYASLAPPPARDEAEGPYAKPVRPPGSVEGDLKEMPVPVLLQSIATNRRTGKLEILGEESVGEIFFDQGVPVHAGTPNAYGDNAVKEVVTWDRGTFLFTPDLRTTMRSIEQSLDTSIAEGKIRADQKRHLKRAGLTYESYLVRKHKNLGESELKLMLTKGEPLDWELQREIYDYLKFKRTFTDLLRDKPMDSEKSTTLLYNFLSCGLIEIKEGDSFKGTVLDFMGEAKGQVDAIQESFTRPETGIYHYQALMFFARYEFFRFEAYNYPMSLIVFQMQNKRDDGSGGVDMLNTQASNAASMRIDLVKRPLDVLGHFETIDYALLLPNTRASSAAFIANRMYEALTATPLTKGVDRSTLMLAFGIANLPNDGDDLESLVLAAKAAKEEAQRGSFPVVLSRSKKR